ncbi:Rrf2 family transcriptional regulator [Arthrobacter sp. GMC3]|uniref:RrF2 family transcriptional regulator n=1 Tax=Arthrobacter sp. GMC3 TaxID=2058894 RepID=UPI000CE3C166|nr:Rrf2 family transcriptional regulator [Arthrobacter sp. GMC3]
MRLSAFSDVCLRVLLVLNASGKSELLTTQSVADMVGTPYNHVSKSMLKLRNLGLVEAVRGRSGGVRISTAGTEISVGGVLRTLNEHNDVAACRSEAGDCPLLHDCGLRGALNRAREAFYLSLDTVTIGGLSKDKQQGPVPLTLSTTRPR